MIMFQEHLNLWFREKPVLKCVTLSDNNMDNFYAESPGVSDSVKIIYYHFHPLVLYDTYFYKTAAAIRIFLFL